PGGASRSHGPGAASARGRASSAGRGRAADAALRARFVRSTRGFRGFGLRAGEAGRVRRAAFVLALTLVLFADFVLGFALDLVLDFLARAAGRFAFVVLVAL